MRSSMIGVGAALVLMLAVGTAAAPLPDGGMTVREVADVLQERGYRAEIGKDSAGDPIITSGAGGVTFRIYFYGCTNERCTSIQFAAGFDLDAGMSLERVNEWNRRHRFGRAYLDEENDPYVEMDVDVELGFSTESLASNLDTWASVLPAFRSFIREDEAR